MNKKRMIEELLDAFEDAISSGESEECAHQFDIWMQNVESALQAAKMTDEHEVWEQARQRRYFRADENSFPAQAKSMKAILIGILDRLYGTEPFIHGDRISQLRAAKFNSFDLAKLIKLCEELNLCYANNCFFAVAALTRALLDHVPPIFGYRSFSNIANNYGGGRSFKSMMQHLELSSRKIADIHLHSQIQQTVSLPNELQVNFSSDVDVLLCEITSLLERSASNSPHAP